MTTRELSRIVEGVEAVSARSFHSLAPGDVALRMGVVLEEIGGATVTGVRRSSHRSLNRVVNLGVSRPATRTTVDRILEFYRSHGIRRFGVALSPCARPRTLESWLTERGFRRTPGGAKLWRGADPVQEAEGGGLTIERVGPEQAADWFDVFSDVFRHFRSRGDWFQAAVGREGWHHYAAVADGRMVGAAILFEADGVGQLAGGATPVPWRRRGIQRMLIAARIRDGLARGIETFTSETVAPLPRNPLISFRNLQRAGFQLAYVRPTYVFEA